MSNQKVLIVFLSISLATCLQAFAIVRKRAFSSAASIHRSMALHAVLVEDAGEEIETANSLSDLNGKRDRFARQDEKDIFKCDEYVALWEDLNIDETATAESNLRYIATIASDFAQKGPRAMSFWLKHVGRSSYFVGNALLGNVAFALNEVLVKNNQQFKFGDGLPADTDLSSETLTGLLLDAALCVQQDYRAIESGLYREPWDMELNHRQSSPLNVLMQTSRFIEESVAALSRRHRGMQEDKDIWISGETSPSLYPDYYRNAFHYQTDGWMSKKQADVYETSTETLFLGRQDAMQRTSLKPIMELSKKLKEEGRPMRVLEVACGTGRFMTFVRDSLPLDTEYTAVDLSPYFLDAASENDSYWRRTRKSKEVRDGQGSVNIAPAKLVQAQAESLPFEDESFDVVLCVYLFHEIPRDVRTKAAFEMARVAAKGGTVVLTDSVQIGDRPFLDNKIGAFGDFNEPYYRDYIQDSTSSHFQAAGLQPSTKAIRSTTKSLSFLK